MKKIMLQYMTLGLALLAFMACEKDKNLDHTAVTAVKNIFTPEDNRFVKLQPATSASVVFEWEQAKAEDGGLVMYEIAFDKEGGDFSKPVYKMVSDNGGVYNRATVTHKTLNSVASLAGIPSLGTGKLKWTVYSSKGINEVKSAVTRTIELQRPAGFATLPADVFLTGTATEAGATLASAAKLKQVANGIFEIYTSLKAGTYNFADRNTGTPTTYSISGGDLKEGGTTTVTGATKVYRINLDFNNASVTMTEVKEIGLWFAPNNTIWFNLNYTANGIWKAENQSIVFRQESWGRDERYKFRLKVNDGTADSFEWMGSSNADNQRPTSGSPASYWFLNKIANNDQWNYCYKFQTEADNKNCDIIVNFTTGGSYTHQVVIK
ncbi:MAG: SusE domain-containing protein [Niastella sp.]|nr:SusE domain-containing protein [Niastella sp.]